MKKFIEYKVFGYIAILSCIGVSLVTSTFFDYKYLLSKGFSYTWIVTVFTCVIVFFIVNLICFQVTALSRYAFLKMRYSLNSPLILFPILINRVDKNVKVAIGRRGSTVYYDFLEPKDYYGRSQEELVEILKNGIIARKVGRYIFLTIAFVVLLIIRPICSLIVVIMFVEFEAIDMIYDRKIHGDNCKLMNIKLGKAGLYLDGVYNEEEFVDWYKEDKNKSYILSNVKKNLLKAINNEKYEEPYYVQKILEQLFECPEEISMAPDDSELDIVTLYVFFAVFSQDAEKVSKIRKVILIMKEHFGQYSKLWYDYFSWFLEIIDFYLWGNTIVTKEKPMLLRYDSWCRVPGEYLTMINKIESRIENYTRGNDE